MDVCVFVFCLFVDVIVDVLSVTESNKTLLRITDNFDLKYLSLRHYSAKNYTVKI